MTLTGLWRLGRLHLQFFFGSTKLETSPAQLGSSTTERRFGRAPALQGVPMDDVFISLAVCATFLIGSLGLAEWLSARRSADKRIPWVDSPDFALSDELERD